LRFFHKLDEVTPKSLENLPYLCYNKSKLKGENVTSNASEDERCEKMFATGDYVIYGRVGICRVKGVTTMEMAGVPGDRLYYVLSPNGKSDGTIYTPVDGMKQVLRPVMTKEEAENLISSLPEIEELSIENEKLREEKYKECMRTCDGTELFRIIKTIYSRKRKRLKCGKRVTAVDERYMKLAEDNLYSELSLLLGVPKDKMVSYISEKIAAN